MPLLSRFCFAKAQESLARGDRRLDLLLSFTKMSVQENLMLKFISHAAKFILLYSFYSFYWFVVHPCMSTDWTIFLLLMISAYIFYLDILIFYCTLFYPILFFSLWFRDVRYTSHTGIHQCQYSLVSRIQCEYQMTVWLTLFLCLNSTICIRMCPNLLEGLI